MNSNELIPHLFRTEYSKIVIVLCSIFGLNHIDTAEDIASETFKLALETWPHKGIPENPSAWLYTVAKNKTRNLCHREDIFQKNIVTDLKSSSEISQTPEIDLSEKLWNRELIAKGAWYLHQASRGSSISKYHLEAGIAYWQTVKEDTQEK